MGSECQKVRAGGYNSATIQQSRQPMVFCVRNSLQSDQAEPMAVHLQALAEGRFVIQQCKDCGKHVFSPRLLCPHCGADDLKWVEPTGHGVVCSIPEAGQTADDPAQCPQVLIELDEGPRLLGRVMDVEPAKLTIGMKVSAHIALVDGLRTLVFYNKEQGSREW